METQIYLDRLAEKKVYLDKLAEKVGLETGHDWSINLITGSPPRIQASREITPEEFKYLWDLSEESHGF